MVSVVPPGVKKTEIKVGGLDSKGLTTKEIRARVSDFFMKIKK